MTSEQVELKNIMHALDESAIVAITDHKGTITHVNAMFCEISKYSKEELIGNTHSMINSGHHPDEFFNNMWKRIASGKIWKAEIKNKAKDGSFYWVDTTIVPIKSLEDKNYRFIAIRFDITPKKELELELKEALKHVREEQGKAIYAEKMASLGEMSAGIAHELGNPLGAIRGRMEMLDHQIQKGNIDPEKIHSTLQKVIGLSDRMSKIIRGLTAYARDGSKDPFMKTSVTGLINDIIDFSTEKFRKLGIEVHTHGLDEDTTIQCREAEVGQIFVNLISNACDATKNQAKPQIWVELSKDEDNIKIKVSDNGKGIHPEIRKKIFNAFYTTKPIGQGTGLGLSISKNIIEAHHGKLTLSDEDKNTTFIIELPRSQPKMA